MVPFPSSDILTDDVENDQPSAGGRPSRTRRARPPAAASSHSRERDFTGLTNGEAAAAAASGGAGGAGPADGDPDADALLRKLRAL